MGSQSQVAYPPWLDPEALVDFIDDLRLAGFNIGIAQFIAAQDLVLALTAQSVVLEEPEQFSRYLGPILCGTPEDQTKFQYHFDQWIVYLQSLSGEIDPGKHDTEPIEQTIERTAEKSKRWRWVIAISGFVVLITGIIIYISVFRSVVPPPEIVQTNNNIPIQENSQAVVPPPEISPIQENPQAVVPPPENSPIQENSQAVVPPPEISPIQENSQTNLGFWQSVFVLSLIVMVIVFLARKYWWYRRARMFLERRSTTSDPSLYHVTVKGFEDDLFPNVPVMRISQNFRRHKVIPSKDLDIIPTIHATINKAGWFTPIYGHRLVTPEYIVLVNRTSFRDHLSRFVDELIHRLTENEVYINTYYFDNNPRICFPANDQNSPVTLQTLSTRFGLRRLIIFSNTDGFFSGRTGEIEPWIDQLLQWPERAFVTPEATVNWGYQEQELAKEFLVLPATTKGLVRLSWDMRQMNYETLDLDALTETATPYPFELNSRPRRWVERNPPNEEIIEETLESLKGYLGRGGFYWLVACAIYPEIHWNLTLYLGNSIHLDGNEKLFDTRNLLNLVRTPWFREGYIPDWLRQRLIASLSTQQEQNIRIALQALLLNVVQESEDGLQLEFAREHEGTLKQLTSPILRILSRNAEANAPVQEKIFLTFIRGRSQNPLAVNVPAIWRDLTHETENVEWEEERVSWRTGMLRTWYQAIRRPSEEFFRQQSKMPNATARTGAIWMMFVTLPIVVLILFLGLIVNTSGDVFASVFASVFVSVFVSIFTPIILIGPILFYTALLHISARIMGGKGSFSKYFYLYSTFFAPIFLLSILVYFIPILGLFVSIFLLIKAYFLTYRITKINYNLTRSRAFIAAIIIPSLMFSCCSVSLMLPSIFAAPGQ